MVRTARPFEIEETQQFWLAGAPAASLGSELMETVDPSTGERIACVPVGTVEDVERAVMVATAAQREWVALPLPQRMRFLRLFADRVREHREELAYLDALDSGNPIREMRKDVEYGDGRSSTSRDSPRRSRVRRSLRASAISTTRCASRSASSRGSSRTTIQRSSCARRSRRLSRPATRL